MTAMIPAVTSAKNGEAVVGIRDRGWFEDPLFGRTRVRVDGRDR